MITDITYGSLVLVDGRDKARVTGKFLEEYGSSSYMFPHYKVDFIDGDQNVAVSYKRVKPYIGK